MEQHRHILDHITTTIVARFDPRRVVLFGSRVRGEADDDSDYDIFVEMDSDKGRAQRSADVDLSLYPRSFSLDVVVYTPDEVQAFRGRAGSLVSLVEAEGEVLYERGQPSG